MIPRKKLYTFPTDFNVTCLLRGMLVYMYMRLVKKTRWHFKVQLKSKTNKKSIESESELRRFDIKTIIDD